VAAVAVELAERRVEMSKTSRARFTCFCSAPRRRRRRPFRVESAVSVFMLHVQVLYTYIYMRIVSSILFKNEFFLSSFMLVYRFVIISRRHAFCIILYFVVVRCIFLEI